MSYVCPSCGQTASCWAPSPSLRTVRIVQFQERVARWMQQCFGPEVTADKMERNFRFLEEALELVQAMGCGQDDAHALVNYVFNRPVGEATQEVGGVLVTLAALCSASKFDLDVCGETELDRVWTKIDVIRRKQAEKKIRSGPLP